MFKRVWSWGLTEVGFGVWLWNHLLVVFDVLRLLGFVVCEELVLLNVRLWIHILGLWVWLLGIRSIHHLLSIYFLVIIEIVCVCVVHIEVIKSIVFLSIEVRFRSRVWQIDRKLWFASGHLLWLLWYLWVFELICCLSLLLYPVFSNLISFLLLCCIHEWIFRWLVDRCLNITSALRVRSRYIWKWGHCRSRVCIDKSIWMYTNFWSNYLTRDMKSSLLWAPRANLKKF